MILRLSGTVQEVRHQISRAIDAELGKVQGSTNALVVFEHRETEPQICDAEFARLMAEAAADTVSFGHMDDSREAMYTRAPGE